MTATKKPYRGRQPMAYRLAARAQHVARDIERDHGDTHLADLLRALAVELTRETTP